MCVLLGASFYFVSISLILFRIVFCIFSFNKNVKGSLYYAYFASLYVAVSKQKVYRCCKNSLGKSECDKRLNSFRIVIYKKFSTVCYFFRIFGVREV